MNHAALPKLSAGRIALRWLFIGVILLAAYATVLAQGGGPTINIDATKTVQ